MANNIAINDPDLQVNQFIVDRMQMREKMKELVRRLTDLRDIERFQKDQEGSSLWSLINRLREIDDYVSCINMIKGTLESLEIRSEGMLSLRQIVSDISRESNFEELKLDIDETLEKARSLKSITIGVNLDGMLRPRTAGVLSLNDTKFTDVGLMRRFVNFSKKTRPCARFFVFLFSLTV